ncbi:MAG: hypothetical protein QOG62_1033 [Thermoleophilaceae bacterium]|nr:hypothetical protein [Thermoleophilaceae bacterium]
MSALALKRGVVTEVRSTGPAAEIVVEVDGQARPALAYTELTGPVETGDDVVVNTAAVDLGLGSGGFDLLLVNLTRGLGLGDPQGAHVMKLNYTPLQYPVHPVEEVAGDLVRPLARPVAVISLHAQLPCVAWAADQHAAGVRIGYVQTVGGALSGAHSKVVRDLRKRGLLAGHVTAGAAFGGEHEAISVAGALHAGLTALEWDAAIVGPGPGILGSSTTLGHGGMAAVDSAHAAMALGCATVIVPRMSSGDVRERHRGLSHHTRTALELMLRAALVALPDDLDDPPDLPNGHRPRSGKADLAGYAASGLPARTMGRSIEEDDLFFRSALAGGDVLGSEIRGL